MKLPDLLSWLKTSEGALYTSFQHALCLARPRSATTLVMSRRRRPPPPKAPTEPLDDLRAARALGVTGTAWGSADESGIGSPRGARAGLQPLAAWARQQRSTRRGSGGAEPADDLGRDAESFVISGSRALRSAEDGQFSDGGAAANSAVPDDARRERQLSSLAAGPRARFHSADGGPSGGGPSSPAGDFALGLGLGLAGRAAAAAAVGPTPPVHGRPPSRDRRMQRWLSEGAGADPPSPAGRVSPGEQAERRPLVLLGSAAGAGRDDVSGGGAAAAFLGSDRAGAAARGQLLRGPPPPTRRSSATEPAEAPRGAGSGRSSSGSGRNAGGATRGLGGDVFDRNTLLAAAAAAAIARAEAAAAADASAAETVDRFFLPPSGGSGTAADSSSRHHHHHHSSGSGRGGLATIGERSDAATVAFRAAAAVETSGFGRRAPPPQRSRSSPAQRAGSAAEQRLMLQRQLGESEGGSAYARDLAGADPLPVTRHSSADGTHWSIPEQGARRSSSPAAAARRPLLSTLAATGGWRPPNGAGQGGRAQSEGTATGMMGGGEAPWGGSGGTSATSGAAGRLRRAQGGPTGTGAGASARVQHGLSLAGASFGAAAAAAGTIPGRRLSGGGLNVAAAAALRMPSFGGAAGFQLAGRGVPLSGQA